MINFAAIGQLVSPIFQRVLSSPVVQQEITTVSASITGCAVDLVEQELNKACQPDGIGRRIWRLIIKKTKEMFGMNEVVQAVGAAAAVGVEMTLEQKKQEVEAKLQAEIAAQQAQKAAGQPYSETVIWRNNLWIALINGADNMILNALMNKITGQ